MTIKDLKELQSESENLGLYDNPEDKIIRVLDKGFVRLIDNMGNDSSIVQMARVSYGDGTKKVSEDEGLIRYLMRNRHTSPFEGVTFKFHIKAPIFVFRQWHRHRMWSFNEISGRYSEMPDEFYVPDENKITTQNPDNKQGGTDDLVPFHLGNEINGVRDDRGDTECESWSEIFQSEQENTRWIYENYLKSGMRKELARINLPLSQYSEMYAVVDLHNLFHFLKLRQDNHAQYEIRVYADALLELIRQIVPISVKAYEDYIKNSMFFSQKELEILSKYLKIDKNIDLDEIFKNTREKKEFLNKLDTLSGFTK